MTEIALAQPPSDHQFVNRGFVDSPFVYVSQPDRQCVQVARVIQGDPDEGCITKQFGGRFLAYSTDSPHEYPIMAQAPHDVG